LVLSLYKDSFFFIRGTTQFLKRKKKVFGDEIFVQVSLAIFFLIQQLE